MTDFTKIAHGTSLPCGTCGVTGRVDKSPSDDGPEFNDWIGATKGKEVCWSCYGEEAE